MRRPIGWRTGGLCRVEVGPNLGLDPDFNPDPDRVAGRTSAEATNHSKEAHSRSEARRERAREDAALMIFHFGHSLIIHYRAVGVVCRLAQG